MEGGSNIQERDEPLLPRDDDDDDDNDNNNNNGEESGCLFNCCDPKGAMHRFIALIFMCFLGFGSYFCYDNPAALEDYIKRDLNITTTQYVMLYSIYSWPNVVLCFIGGFLIDSVFGIRLGTNIYMGLTLMGQIVFASGVFIDMYWMMIAGRFIFGIGAESLSVAQNNYAVLWFKGKELNMVFGLQLSFARVGSTVNFLVMETIYKWVNQKYEGPTCLGIILFIATSTCLFSMLCALILGLMDKRAERLLRRNETTNNEVVRLKDITGFTCNFWLITVICVAYYVAIFPFIGLGKDFFKNRFHMNNHDANFINSIVYLLSGFVSPVLGLLIDKCGKNLSWIMLAVSATITAHCLLGFTQINPFVGIITMGIAYSCLASSLWPLVALIIPEHQLGTAYGVCQAVQNLGLAVFTILAGIIVDNFGYVWMEVFFISSLSVAVLFTIALWIVDIYKSNGVLNMTPSERQQHQHQILAANILEREKLLASSCEEGGVSNTGNIQESHQPSTDFQIRNRYLSRIGATVSDDNDE